MLYDPLPLWKERARQRTACSVFSLDPPSGALFRVSGSGERIMPEPAALVEVLRRWQTEAHPSEGSWNSDWRGEQTLLAQMMRARPCACDDATAAAIIGLPGYAVLWALRLPRLIGDGDTKKLERALRAFARALAAARATELARYAGEKPPATDILWAPIAVALGALGIGTTSLPEAPIPGAFF